MKNHSKKLYNGMSSAMQRRIRARDRLEKQLASGVKTSKESGEPVPLTQSDINRIQKELDILKSRII